MQKHGSTSHQPAVNDTALAAMRDLLGEDFSLMLKTYLSTSGETFHKLTSALEANDLGELKLQAHSLKSACLNVGAELLSAMSAEMEQLIQDQKLGQVEQRVAALLQEGERVKLHLEQVYNQL